MVLKGLNIANSLNNADANDVTLAYAYEAANILYAEAYIAEQRFQQVSLTAKTFEHRMLAACGRLRQGIRELKELKELRNAATRRSFFVARDSTDISHRLRPVGKATFVYSTAFD
jgi:hypothetical protein